MNEHEVFIALYGRDLFLSVPHYKNQVLQRHESIGRDRVARFIRGMFWI